MGTVYRAVDEALERDVAIKVLNSDITEPDVIRRFRAEAVTLARLNHPGIATLYDLYQENGELLMVMEFVRGDTLQRLSERTGPMPLEHTTALCLQVLDALAYAHRLGIIHRDLKPSNLMLTDTGAVKVMDFGIARIVGSEHLTSEGSMMGTPAYMAPEQVRGGEIDARADLYAMGVVLYRLLTAKLPFDAETPIAIAHKQLSDPPTPLKLTRPDLPLWCEAVLERALAKSPDDRFQAAEEFRAALAVWAGSGAMKRVAAVSPGEATTYALPTPIGTPRQPSGILSEPKRATASQSLSESSGPQKTDVAPGRLEQTPSTQRTVVIPGKYFFAGTGVLALLLIALVAAVFFVLARPLGVPPPAEEASPAVAAASQPAADPGGASPEPGPAPPAEASSPEPGPAPPVAADGRQKAAEPAAVTAESSVASPTRTGVSKTAAGGTGTRADGPEVDRTPTPASESRPAESTEGTAGTSETRRAAARALPPMTFEPVKLLVSDGNRSRERDAKLHFADGQLILVAVGERLIASVAFEDILALSYSRSRQPRWRNANGTDSRGDLPGGAFGFLKADRRWFAMQTRTHTYVVRVDENQIGPLMSAASDRTGLEVVRLTDKP